MVSLNSIFSTVRFDLQQYDSSNLIDNMSLYRWANYALRGFGTHFSTIQESIVNVVNNQADIPENFQSLRLAVKCNPYGYHYEGDDRYLMNSFSWKEKTEYKCSFNSCDPCCATESESIITEKTVVEGLGCSYYYNNPTFLKLTKGVDKSLIHKSCANLRLVDSPYEMSIVQNKIRVNFKEGSIYLRYYGLPVDEDGEPCIPSDLTELLNYIEYYLKFKVHEAMFLNGDITDRIKVDYLDSKQRSAYTQAGGQIKMKDLSNYSSLDLKNKQRLWGLHFEVQLPSVIEKYA